LAAVAALLPPFRGEEAVVPTPVEFEDDREGDIMRIRVRGELCLPATDSLHAHVRGVLADDAVGGIILDLGEVIAIDSSGVGALIECWRQAPSQGKPLRVLGAAARVSGLLTMMGLTDILADPMSPSAP
jgi:anti-anti-sigma factor